jgi:hypothetical protein
MNRTTLIGVSALAALLCTGMARADEIHVRVNGEPISFEGTQPRAMDGRVMVPLRGVLEKMGATVDWMPATQTVVAAKNGMEINLPIGSRHATVNGKDVMLDVPATTIAGSTMVPLRFVSEALGADVRWQSASQTVLIDTNGVGGIARNEGPRDVTFNNQTPRRPREYRRTRAVTLPAGTVIPVKLDDTLNSRDNREGDSFTATLESGRDDAGLPVGTKVQGVIHEAIPSRNGKPGVLDVDFRRIIFPDGTERTLDASVISLDNKSINRGDNGRLVARSSNANNERLKWVGIGAGAGLLLSTLTKGNTLLDTLLGGGAGYLYNELQRKGAGDVNLKAGTEMGVKLNRSFAFSSDRLNSDYDRSR